MLCLVFISNCQQDVPLGNISQPFIPPSLPYPTPVIGRNYLLYILQDIGKAFKQRLWNHGTYPGLSMDKVRHQIVLKSSWARTKQPNCASHFRSYRRPLNSVVFIFFNSILDRGSQEQWSMLERAVLAK